MFTATWHGDGILSYITNMRTAMGGVAQRGALNMVSLAQGNVAVDTSSLHDTIDAEQMVGAAVGDLHQWSVNAGDTSGGYKGDSSYNNRQAGAPVDYAIAQEYDHQPFMTPASEEGWQQMVQDATATMAGVKA